MKKKALFVVALAFAFVLSMTAIAQAKYAGYAYNNPVLNADSTTSVNKYPGYLSWSGAQAIYARNNPSSPAMTSAHGGYVSTTTKCAVCHSAHRAYSATATTAGTTPTDLSLSVGNACVNCHTAWGAGSSSKKIEWANVDQGLAAGPHASANFPNGCTSKCHTGGVHGGGGSTYNGMNAFMLGGDKDAAITTAFVNGNTGANISYVAGGGDGAGLNWFQSGTANVPSDGLTPAGGATGTGAKITASQFAAAKGMATGYTCAQTGCHTSSQFAVNSWGFSENHASDPRVSTNLDTPFTGHVIGTATTTNHVGASCGPCHPGNAAGGYRVNTAANQKAAAYGCDQCHDMVGKLTNTTAFPHGNRNIDVWEWDDTGAQVTTALPAAGGNLWMYQGNIAATAANVGAQIDKSFKVIEDATDWSSATGTGNINDGTCLKCHIPVDDKSITALGLPAGTKLYAASSHSHSYTPGMTQSSNLIYTWK